MFPYQIRSTMKKKKNTMKETWSSDPQSVITGSTIRALFFGSFDHRDEQIVRYRPPSF